MIFLLYLFILISFVTGRNEEYKGYKVYNVNFKTLKQQDNLHFLKNDFIDFWTNPCVKYNRTGKAMVPPSSIKWFEGRLKEIDVEVDVHIADVYQYLSEKEQYLVNTKNANRAFDFNSYYRYNEILNYLYFKQEEYTNNTNTNLELIEFGVTEQNRPLVYLKLTNNNTNTEKPIIIIEAGINPREWITIPSALNIVDKLLENAQIRLLDEFEWIVIPVLNPDGYEYTHTNMRLWTKSRSTRSHMGIICPGVHLNRNFDIDWQNSDSSSSPCSHIYAGREPLSEPESQMIKTLLEINGRRVQTYISLQNNIGFISYPWNFERASSGMFRQHYQIGLEMIKAIGDDYNLDIGSVALGDRVSGTSTDYVRISSVLYTFNIDIADKGDGVIIPEEDIQGIADDVWKAVDAAARSIIEINNL